MKKTSAIKLSVELVPQTSWCNNVRSKVDTYTWDIIRKSCYRKANYLCEICGGKGKKHPVECHEIWHYNDKTHIQKLAGLISLCPDCHSVKHIGKAVATGKAKKAIKHLAKVNQWTESQCQEYLKECFDLWAVRSLHQWKLDLSWLEDHYQIKVLT